MLLTLVDAASLLPSPLFTFETRRRRVEMLPMEDADDVKGVLGVLTSAGSESASSRRLFSLVFVVYLALPLIHSLAISPVTPGQPSFASENARSVLRPFGMCLWTLFVAHPCHFRLSCPLFALFRERRCRAVRSQRLFHSCLSVARVRRFS
jgi:hypothetical protein